MVSQPLPIATVHPGGNRKPKRLDQAPVRQTAEEDIFTKALLELPCEYKHRNPIEWAFSLLLHGVVIAALIIVPLCFTQVIDLKAFQTNWLVAPAPPGPPPPPPAQAVRVVKSVPRLIHGGKMMAPTVIPKNIAIIKEEPLPPDTSDGVVGGVPGGIPGGQVGGVLAGIIGSTGNSMGAIAAPPPPVKRILRVGGDLKPPRRVHAVDPQYPFIAKQAKVQGVVIVDAIIDEQGNVVQAHVVSGPGLLLAAALEAVGQWKYEPTRLNGEPISVQMHVEVHFVLQ